MTSLLARAAIVALAAGLLACSGDTTEMSRRDIAVLETTKGTIEIAFFPKSAPLAVENFQTHVRNGYYDGTHFHRIIPSFVIQGGDPTGTGRGGESIWGDPFPDEFDPDLRYERAGLVGMANWGPGTNGSQFFITLRPTPWLNDRHTLFGVVIYSSKTIAAIAAAGSTSGQPSEEVTIVRTTMRRRSHWPTGAP